MPVRIKKFPGDKIINKYIITNEKRWNAAENDDTKAITHEALEEAKTKPMQVGLTVGKCVPAEWFEKAKGKKLLGLACGGGRQGPVFAAHGYDVTIMDFSTSQLEKDALLAK